MYLVQGNNQKTTFVPPTILEDLPTPTTSMDSSSDPQPQPQSTKNINDANVFDKEAANFDYLLTDNKFAENKKLWLQDQEFEILNQLVMHLKNTPTVFVNHHYIRNILKTYFDQSYLKKLTETHRKIIVKAVFVAAIIRALILVNKDDYSDASRDKFLRKYSEFESVESKWELLALIRFERALSIALQYLQGKGNKQLLLSIAAHLEGSNMQYVTGGQPSPGTKRRVLIFERLSGVRPVKRAKRDEAKKNGTPGKEGETTTTPRKGKKRQLTTMENDEDGDDTEEFMMENSDSEGDASSGNVHGASGVHGSISNACAALDLLSKIASEQFEGLK